MILADLFLSHGHQRWWHSPSVLGILQVQAAEKCAQHLKAANKALADAEKAAADAASQAAAAKTAAETASSQAEACEASKSALKVAAGAAEAARIAGRPHEHASGVPVAAGWTIHVQINSAFCPQGSGSRC